MPIFDSSFSTPSQSKADSLQSTSEAKAVLLSDISTQKRERMLSPVDEAIKSLHSEIQSSIDSKPFSAYVPPVANETLAESAVRGGYEALIGVPMTAVGLAAGGAAIGEKVFGKGGFATDLKESAVDSYRQFEEELGKNSRPEDSATYSYNQAKEGNLGALLSWAAHGSGYVSAQLGSMLVGVGLVEKGVELTGKKAVGQLMKTWVEKEAGALAKSAGVEAVTPELIAQATSQVAGKVGQQLGMAATGFGMEGGEILGDLASQTVGKDGTSERTLTGEEILKGLVGTAAAGAVEYTETALGVKALKGALGKLPGKALNEIDGLAGKAVRAGVGAAKVAPAEFAQEFVQTGIEQKATGKDLDFKEMADAGWLGAIGAQHAVIGAAASNSKREDVVKNVLQDLDRQVKSVAQPGHVEKIQAAVEAKDVSQYVGPDAKTPDPVVAVSALKVMSEKEDTPAIDRDSHYNQAVAIYNGIRDKAGAIMDSAKEGEGLDKDAQAYIDKLIELRTNIGPMIVAMGPKGTTSPELKQKLIEAQDSIGVRDAIANILGSDSRGRDLYQGQVIPTQQILNNENIDEDTKQFVQDIQDLADIKTEIATERDAVKDRSDKTVPEVTNDIFNGSLGMGGQKGITRYLSAIQNAVTAGKTEAATKELDGLITWADERQQRAVDFRAAMSGTPLPTKYNEGRKEPYNIHPGSGKLVKAMELEAAALGKAVALGSTIAGLPSSNPTIASSPHQNVPPSRSASPADPTAPASTMSSTPSARPLAKVGVEDSSLPKIPTATELAGNKEALAPTTVAEPVTEAGKTYTNHSGGAVGSDTHWGEVGSKYGVTSNHYYKDKTPNGNVKISDSMFKEGVEKAKLAANKLGRNWSEKPYVQGLLARNWSQVKNADSVVAIGHISHGMVDGGTGYAVEMAIAEGKPVHLFDQERNKWYKNTDGKWANGEVPTLTNNFAGIGTRSLRDNGKKAIEEVYRNTFENKAEQTTPPTPPDETNKAKVEASAPSGVTSSAEPTKSDTKPVVVNETPKSETQSSLSLTDEAQTDLLEVSKNFLAKKLKHGIHAVSDLLGSMRDIYKSGGLSVQEKVVYAHIGEHIKTTTQAIKELFYDRSKSREVIASTTDNKQRADHEGWLLEDPLNELAPDGILPEKIATAIAAVNYKWLATRGSETWFNDDKDIRQMFDLDDDAEIIDAARQHIQRLGTSVSALSESLGRDIYRMLGYKAKNTTQAQQQERMEVALGLMALASMEKMGMLERKTVSRQAYSKLETAIKLEDTTFTMTAEELALPNVKQAMAAWREAYTGKMSDREAESKKYSSEIGANIKFFRISNKAQGDGKTTGVKATYNKSDRTWDKLFSKEQDTTQYGWEPFNRKSIEKMRKSDQIVPTEQAENKNRNENRPFFTAHNTMNVFDFLAKEHRDVILGKESEEGLQEEQTRAVHSTNVSIDRMYDHMQAWKQSALQQADKLASLFYIPAWFGANSRMYQEGTINPQGNKIHRYLFSMKDWVSKFEPSDPVMSELLLEAVGQSLGIEVSKVGTWAMTKPLVIQKLNDPVIQKALTALDAVLGIIQTDEALEEADLTVLAKDLGSDKLNEYSADIAAGVAVGKEAVHSLKGLIEYQRFLRAKATDPNAEFTTDLTIEIDGKANGSAIGSLQLTAGKLTLEQLALYESMGISFAPVTEGENGDHARVPDPYQSIGGIANTQIKSVMSVLVGSVQTATTDTSIEQELLKELNALQAAENLLGRLNEDSGVLTGAARKIAKNRAVEALYGAGKLKVINGLMSSVLIKDSIQKKITQFANADLTNEKVKADYAVFLLNVNTMAGTTDTMEFGKGVPLNKKAILGIKLSSVIRKGLYKNLETYHGEAIWQGIKTVYKDIRETRNPLNTAISTATAYYNAAYSHLIEEHLSKNAEITVGDLARIREQIKGLFPRVKTPFYDAATDTGYIEVAEFERSKDYVELEPEGHKETTQQRKDREARNAKAEKLAVTQKYNKDTGIVRLTGRPHTIPMLENPGVKGVVTIIHMLDSIPANMLIGNEEGIGVLNVHDGEIVGLHREARTNGIINKDFIEVMQDYNVAEAIQECRDSVMAAMKKLDITPAAKLKALTTEFSNFGLLGSYEVNGKKVYPDVVMAYNRNVDLVKMAKNKTGANKTMVLKAATRVNQYNSSHGGWITGNKVVEQIGSVKTADIIPSITQKELNRAEYNVSVDRELKDFNSTNVQDAFTDGLGSSKKEMSTNFREYQIMEQVNEGNVVDTYDFLKQLSDKQDSPTHDEHLKWILNHLVQRVMNTVDIYLKVNNKDETHGQIDLNTSRVFISSQAAQPNTTSGALSVGIRMSTGEVYTHELVHAVTATGLKENKHLRRQVEILYDLTKKELDKNGEGFRAFLNNPTMDITDPANLYEVEAAKERFDYIFNGGSVKKTSHIDSVTQMEHYREIDNKLEEFVALGLTNENLVKALTQIDLVKHEAKFFEKESWANIRGKNLQDMLINVLNRIMELLWDKFQKGIIQNTVGAELERLAHLLAKIDSKNKTRLYNATKIADLKYRKFMDMGNHYVHQFFKKTPVIRKVVDFKVGLTEAAKSNTPLGQFLRNVDYKYRTLDHGLMKSLVTEMAGHTPRFARIHELLHRRKIFLDSSKTAIAADTKKAANEIFTRELSTEDKVSLYKAMKIDLSGLADTMAVEKIITLVKNRKSVQAEISRIKQEIEASDLKDHAVYYDQNARALGHFMVHSRLRKGEHTFLQTRVIAGLNHTEYAGSLTPAQIDKANEYVNQLGSLYGLLNTSQQDLTRLASIADEDIQGFAQFLGLHNELKKSALKDAFGDSDMLFIKGYTKEIVNPLIDYKLGVLADEKELKAQGYTKSEHPIQRDDSDPTKNIAIYAYTSRTNRVNDFNSQVLSMTNNVGKGADSQRLAQQMGDDTVEGAANNKALIKAKQAAIAAMFIPFVEPTVAASEGNQMVPQVDDTGKITKYRYMMAESNKNDFLEKVNDFDTVMGAMAAQTLDKARSPQINEELVDAMKAVYDDEYSANPGSFIEVGPHSADPRLRERFHMMPAKTRAYVKQQWGNESMFVPKDMLTIAFGYRKYSIMEAFAKTHAERQLLEKIVVGLANMVFRAHGAKVVNNIELVMLALTKLAKNNIVVKSLVVTLGNFGSNMIYLRAKGVPTLKILQLGMTAMRDGIKYQDDKQQLDTLEIKYKLMTDPAQIKEADTQIRKLKDALARNPVVRAMEAGMMPTLVDDVETDVTQNNFPSKTEQVLDKVTKHIPTPFVNVGKVIFLAQDTGAYKIMNNAVKMTDFVGRFILYQHYMEQIQADLTYKQDGEDAIAADNRAHKESVAKVMEEFINFDLPTHKTIEYMNSIGLVWFSKYAIRIQKIIANSIIERPLDAAAAYALSLTSGMDNILNSTINEAGDILRLLSDPVSAFTGSIDEIFPISSFFAVLPK